MTGIIQYNTVVYSRRAFLPPRTPHFHASSGLPFIEAQDESVAALVLRVGYGGVMPLDDGQALKGLAKCTYLFYFLCDCMGVCMSALFACMRTEE
jgi:hypothetical protein